MYSKVNLLQTCQLLTIIFRKMAPRTRRRLQERGRDTPTWGLLWLIAAVIPRLSVWLWKSIDSLRASRGDHWWWGRLGETNGGDWGRPMGETIGESIGGRLTDWLDGGRQDDAGPCLQLPGPRPTRRLLPGVPLLPNPSLRASRFDRIDDFCFPIPRGNGSKNRREPSVF